MTFIFIQEQVYIGVILFLMGMQIYQWAKIHKLINEVQKLWEQISIWNTMVAMKFLDIQKEIDKLSGKKNSKKNNNGEQTQKNSKC